MVQCAAVLSIGMILHVIVVSLQLANSPMRRHVKDRPHAILPVRTGKQWTSASKCDQSLEIRIFIFCLPN